MRNIKLFLGMLFLMMGLVACGDSDSHKSEDFGAVRVVVTNQLTGGNAPSDVSEIEVVLTNDSRTYSDRSGQPFDFVFPRVYTGTYEVSAIAWNDLNEVIFISTTTEVEIVKGSNQTIMIVMNQQGSGDEDTIPQFLSITLPTVVDQGDDALITVEATGGVGTLTLSGRFSASTPVNERGSFSGGGALVNGVGTITWTAPMVKPSAGYAWFILTLTDTNGDQSEMGVTVLVGDDYNSDVAPAFIWNFAPTVDMTTRVLNDGDASTAYLWLTAYDDEDVDMDYAWSSTCNASFVVKPNGPSGGAAPAGVIQSGDTLYFKAEVLGEDRTGPCTMTVTVTDPHGASTVHSVHFDTLEVQPTEL